ncbi:hypothetical protein A3D00_05665 [Candidatus Woesebacteria bacterium RIFCSPHIGHO2_02_FULL_38_9]|uniref:Uncharacterized protein n=1 Tax=Candidatus Woesebacteria bacterium RIFCSPHIGHO2_01_FULL_39_28 TaxID=1802496 RepID=A0A1F7YIQ2_9BACT|nr:MAG: hypothetical protein A2627_01870 [Candidatus Woesebacteria bacterium RIFCSPHIGHO2_01_FULL_39_28]OGM34252.1 MAG: hypothetical protein A3D00_05665 [Candidatus Woesebacteria bacterium RIFCSPHIGHO2_02_FULL_38_9]OGM57020.1 MAG: hypothetical protein A3A50_03485 [Candidatus Woesebacteria bacterium RIFCSPLOWO2_01_FULL_38_20]
MQQKVIIGILILVALVLVVPRLWKASLNEDTGSTRVNLPSFNEYDNSKYPDRSKLLLGAEYLSSIDTNSTYFLEAKESATKKLTQYVGDLDVVLTDIRNDGKSDSALEKFRAEGAAELEELKSLISSNGLNNLKSQRLLFIVVGDWKLLTQASVSAEQKSSIENKFKDLGVTLPK